MKQFLKIILLTCLAGGFFVSCEREKLDYEGNVTDVSSGEGQLDLRTLSIKVAEREGLLDDIISPKANDGVNTDQYIISIVQGENEINTWTYAELPEIVVLPEGSYTIKAMSVKELPDAAFDMPYYFASKDFNIVKNQINDKLGTLVCRLHNVKVLINYDPELKSLMGSDVKTVVTNGKKTLDFTSESQEGYFKIDPQTGKMTLTATLQGTVDGEQISVSKSFNDIEAGYLCRFTFTLRNANGDLNGEAGTIIKPGTPGASDQGFTIDIDLNAKDKNNIDIDFGGSFIEEDKDPNDQNPPVIDPDPVDPEPSEDSPTIIGKSLDGDPFDIDQSHVVPTDGCELIVTLNAPKGMKNVFVTIDSGTLTEDILEGVNLAKSFDLANPGTLKDGLEGLGFPTGDNVIGKEMIDFDITQFAPLLGAFGPATHKFIIRVVDQEENEITKTLTLISE